MVRVKICGITSRADAEAAIAAGADFLGFNFYPDSPRYVEPSLVRVILADLSRPVGTVGVFVNADADRVRATCETSGVGMVQLHGDETPEFCAAMDRPVLKAVRIGGPEDLSGIEEYKVWAMLADSRTPGFGGSGVKPDWALAADAARRTNRLFLAGGLSPENVGEAIRAVQPWAVDVSSGIEKEPGIKDHEKMRRFIQAVKNASE